VAEFATGSALPKKLIPAGAQADRGQLFGWLVKIALGLLVVAIPVLSIGFGLPRLFPEGGVEAAAAILGVALIFTGVLVPCVMAIISRRSAATQTLVDLNELRFQLRRGEKLAQTRDYRRLPKESRAIAGHFDASEPGG
jgi:hypothetical protein